MTSGKVQWIAGALAAAISLSALGVSVADASSQPAPTTQASDEREMVRGPAKTGESDRLDSGGGGGGLFKDWLQTVLALALVIALIVLLRWALKKIGPGGRLFAGGGGAVEVLATTGLSARERLILVRLGERVLLLGSSPGGLRTLCEITDPDEASQLAARFAAGAKPAAEADADRPDKEGDR